MSRKNPATICYYLYSLNSIQITDNLYTIFEMGHKVVNNVTIY
jgi:hypothetical protein